MLFKQERRRFLQSQQEHEAVVEERLCVKVCADRQLRIENVRDVV